MSFVPRAEVTVSIPLPFAEMFLLYKRYYKKTMLTQGSASSIRKKTLKRRHGARP